MSEINHPQFMYKFFVIVFAITLIRVISVFFAPFSLQLDEAQYAGWAHHIAAGYFSKPPFIAWSIAIGQGICSAIDLNSVEGCTRMLQAPALLITAILIAASAWLLLGNRKISAYSALLFLMLPFTGFYSLVATTDAWLMLWWAMALLLFVWAQKNPATWWPWFLCGVAIGFGLLTKYSMGIFVLSAMLYLFTHRGGLKGVFAIKPIASALVALVAFSPNLFWNAQHGFPTLQHHLAISQVAAVEQTGWHFASGIAGFISFVSAQFLVFGPWAFTGLLFVSLTHSFSRIKSQNHLQSVRENIDAKSLLLCFTWPMLAIIMLQAAMSRAHSNWALPAYVAASILVVAFWIEQTDFKASNLKKFLFGKFALNASLVIGLLISIFLMISPYWVASHPELNTSHLNPLRKLQGWKTVALQVKALAQAMPIVAEDRDLLAALSAYHYQYNDTILAWNPNRQKDNHYRWFYDLANAKVDASQTMLLVLVGKDKAPDLKKLQMAFEHISVIQDPILSNTDIGGDYRHAYLFEVRGFKGYP